MKGTPEPRATLADATDGYAGVIIIHPQCLHYPRHRRPRFPFHSFLYVLMPRRCPDDLDGMALLSGLRFFFTASTVGAARTLEAFSDMRAMQPNIRSQRTTCRLRLRRLHATRHQSYHNILSTRSWFIDPGCIYAGRVVGEN